MVSIKIHLPSGQVFCFFTGARVMAGFRIVSFGPGNEGLSLLWVGNGTLSLGTDFVRVSFHVMTYLINFVI